MRLPSHDEKIDGHRLGLFIRFPEDFSCNAAMRAMVITPTE
jgi:hypothetical protein